MEYRIEKMESFKIVGAKIETTNQKKAGYREIPLFWQRISADQKQIEELLSLMDCAPFGLIGANMYNTDANDSRKFDYCIGCASTKETPEHLSEYVIPALTWAVFPCKKEEIGKVQAQIVTKWQKKSGYKVLNTGYMTGRMKSAGPDLEVYDKDGNVEIWVVVEKR